MNRAQIEAKSPKGFKVIFDLEATESRPQITVIVGTMLDWLDKNGYKPFVYSKGGQGKGTPKSMVLDPAKGRVKLYGLFLKTQEERQPLYNAIAEATGVSNMKVNLVFGDRLEAGDKSHYWIGIKYAPAIAAHPFFATWEKPDAASLAAIHDNQ